MSEISENVGTNQTVSLESSSHGSNGELRSMSLTYLLDGKNYLQRSQIVNAFLKGKLQLSWHILMTLLSLRIIQLRGRILEIIWLWNLK